MITIGTDCSGIEAPIQALKNLGINFKHIFSSEIDKFAKQSLLANYDPEFFYDDIHTAKPHKIDIYVCGFPCQTFSILGKQSAESKIFFECARRIMECDPDIFILENVKNITTINKGSIFNEIKQKLDEMMEYDVSYCILNTKDYGVPQTRNRLFIIGIKKECARDKFTIPEKTECKDINEFVEEDNNTYREYPPRFARTKEKLVEGKVFFNLELRSPTKGNYCNTITAHQEVWCIKKHRPATITEILSLQGFPKNFKQVVSNTQMKKQIGNSMSVNVLEKIFEEIFKIYVPKMKK